MNDCPIFSICIPVKPACGGAEVRWAMGRGHKLFSKSPWLSASIYAPRARGITIIAVATSPNQATMAIQQQSPTIIHRVSYSTTKSNAQRGMFAYLCYVQPRRLWHRLYRHPCGHCPRPPCYFDPIQKTIKKKQACSFDVVAFIAASSGNRQNLPQRQNKNTLR